MAEHPEREGRSAGTAGVAAGVPFLAFPPESPGPSTPVVVAWHLMDPPRTEAAFAAALPLEGLDAWRIYLGLPMSGSRMPAGGFQEIMRLAMEDAVLNLYGPIADQALKELEPALAELSSRFALGSGPLGLVGGSMGAAVAQLVMTESDVDVDVAVLISPLSQLRTAVDAMGKRFGIDYQWSEPSLAVAQRLDFVARAGEIAARNQPAVLVVVGGDDDEGFKKPAAELRGALTGRYADASRVALETIPGMGHALAEEPGMEPAPQTAHAAKFDRLAVEWLRRHLAAR